MQIKKLKVIAKSQDAFENFLKNNNYLVEIYGKDNIKFEKALDSIGGYELVSMWTEECEEIE